MRRRLHVAVAIAMTNEEAAWRRYARIVLMRSAQESHDHMAPHVWLREVERDAEPLRCYQGDVAALRRETLAIAALVWGEQVEPR